MANWNDLKNAVKSVIKTNGNQEITGKVLQDVLNNIISNVGLNSSFAGIATPETNPGTPDGNVFYFATTAGTYSNFNGIVINSGEAVILEWKGRWVKKELGFATKEKLTELASDVCSAHLRSGVTISFTETNVYMGDVTITFQNVKTNMSPIFIYVYYTQKLYAPLYTASSGNITFTIPQDSALVCKLADYVDGTFEVKSTKDISGSDIILAYNRYGYIAYGALMDEINKLRDSINKSMINNNRADTDYCLTQINQNTDYTLQGTIKIRSYNSDNTMTITATVSSLNNKLGYYVNEQGDSISFTIDSDASTTKNIKLERLYHLVINRDTNYLECVNDLSSGNYIIILSNKLGLMTLPNMLNRLQIKNDLVLAYYLDTIYSQITTNAKIVNLKYKMLWRTGNEPLIEETYTYGGTIVVKFPKVSSDTYWIGELQDVLGYEKISITANSADIIDDNGASTATYTIQQGYALVANISTQKLNIVAYNSSHKTSDVIIAFNYYGRIQYGLISDVAISSIRNQLSQINFGAYDENVNDVKLLNSVSSPLRTINYVAKLGYNIYISGNPPQHHPKGFYEAYKKGFRYILVDVRETSDGYWVCCHDNDISSLARNDDGTTIDSGTVLISESTLSELQQYDFGVIRGSEYIGFRIPTIEDVLKQIKYLGCHVIVEMKSNMPSTTARDRFVKAVKLYGLQGKVILAPQPTIFEQSIELAKDISSNEIQCQYYYLDSALNDTAYANIQKGIDAGLVVTVYSVKTLSTGELYSPSNCDIYPLKELGVKIGLTEFSPSNYASFINSGGADYVDYIAFSEGNPIDVNSDIENYLGF